MKEEKKVLICSGIKAMEEKVLTNEGFVNIEIASVEASVFGEAMMKSGAFYNKVTISISQKNESGEYKVTVTALEKDLKE